MTQPVRPPRRSEPVTPPAITRRTPAEIEAIRSAGALAAAILTDLRAAAAPGLTTAYLDERAHQAMRAAGAEPLFLGYSQGVARPFPATTCISTNDEIVHGIPGERELRPGDLVSVDVGLRLDGWCADTATTFIVGDVAAAPAQAQALIEETRQVLAMAIALIRPGRRWSEIGAALESRAGSSAFGIVTEYVGHGIGRTLHEPPKAPAYATGFSGFDFELESGMVLAVEPMLTGGRGPGAAGAVGEDGLPSWRSRVKLCADGWTVATADGSLACHEEHTVAVTDEGCDVLTRRPVEMAADLR
ncbi:MAG: type I methionyl aminopeptidase [Phycisphaerales bacterium]|nr:type I methionyl aminopeptidase [Phycisphaerales bacterium]